MSFTSIDHCSNSLGLYSVFVIINIRPFSFIITKKGRKANTKKFAVVLRLINKLKELSEKYPDQFILIRKGPQRAVTYRIPKRCIGIRPPYSEERKQRQVRDAKANGLPFSNLKKEVDHNE